MERDVKERENESVIDRGMYALKLGRGEKIQQELKEAQYGGLLGKVKNGNVRETRLSWGSLHLGLRQSVSNPRIISVYITAMVSLPLGQSSLYNRQNSTS